MFSSNPNCIDLVRGQDEKIESKATKSIKSPVKNLKSQDPTISVDKVLSSVGYEFLRSDSTGNDGGEKQIQHQRGFQMVNPTNEWFVYILLHIQSKFRTQARVFLSGYEII